MNSVYIFGPIFLHGEDYLPVYKHLYKLCQKYFKEVVGTYPDFWKTQETSRQFYDRTYEVVTKCDLFIGEVSSPSFGVGMEFQMAQEHKIPCIGICKEVFATSPMILGLPTLKEIIHYKDLADLSNKLEQALPKYIK